jgi:ABC-type Mn2+/Zn2+ transport system permease subunit
MIDLLIEPLSLGFMRRALLAAVLAGSVASLVGTYVVLRGMAFLGGALSHAVLPGIAIAYLLGLNIFAGAFLAGGITAIGIGFISRHERLKEDTAIGILLSGMFALGVAIISTLRSYSVDLTSLLFGNVLAVSGTDIRLTALVGVLVLLAFWLFNRRWVALCFDPQFAAAVGLPVTALHYGLIILMSLAIVTAMQTVGVVLALAMLVTPPATARLFTDRVGAMMLLSVLLGTVSSLVGLYGSYYLNIASGAAIVLVSVCMFFIALLIAPRKGMSVHVN